MKRIIWLLVPILAGLSGVAADTPSGKTPEFYWARLVYRNNNMRGFSLGPGNQCGGGGYRTDTPNADEKFTWGIQRLTGISVYHDTDNPVHYVEIMDPKLFDHPFIYTVEPGSMDLNDQEAAQLREYLLRGGFWHADDFWGPCQFQNVVQQLHKVFPERNLEEVPLSDEVFHTFFDVNTVMQIPNINNARQVFRGNPNAHTWEQAADITPRIFGLRDDKHRLMVIVTYNSDLGDAWEWMDDPEYPQSLSGQAYRMGIDFILYSMTH